MTENVDLSAKCWSYPEENFHYLEKGTINIELTNHSKSKIQIQKIVLKFNTEENFKDYKISYSGVEINIDPKKVHTRIEIPFRPELSLREETNTYQLIIKYKKDNSESIVSTIPTYHYIILRPSFPQIEYFFISHKDPDDTENCKKFVHFLEKIGFKGFMAEIEKRPGIDIWKNKIYPGIDSCLALIIIWTNNAKKNPKSILKEIKYAKKKKKKIILICQKGITLPKKFPKYTEFLTIPKKFSVQDLAETVETIYETYRNGLYTDNI